jgi:wyosine [tRNA(Phe)-imidazoG37] synthetase (radical SAM superfamily)
VAKSEKYLFGPVLSRRLGRSLGVDIVPFKVCSLDCIYCQLGLTSQKTIERKPYVPLRPVLDELEKAVAKGLQADFITFSGSGEPTLNSLLGQFIDGVRKLTDIPVAILTNGTLFYRDDVRADCAKADVVLPSLDAGDEQTFRKINRPHPDLTLEKLIEGLTAFRKEFQKPVWLEVFLLEGINTDPDQIEKIKSAIKRIRPDKIQLNTAVRPTTETGLEPLDDHRLSEIAAQIGDKCEVIADTSPIHPLRGEHRARAAAQPAPSGQMKDLLSILKRRPCSLEDLASALSLNRAQVLKYLDTLQRQGLIQAETKDGTTFFKAS